MSKGIVIKRRSEKSRAINHRCGYSSEPGIDIHLDGWLIAGLDDGMDSFRIYRLSGDTDAPDPTVIQAAMASVTVDEIRMMDSMPVPDRQMETE